MCNFVHSHVTNVSLRLTQLHYLFVSVIAIDRLHRKQSNINTPQHVSAPPKNNVNSYDKKCENGFSIRHISTFTNQRASVASLNPCMETPLHLLQQGETLLLSLPGLPQTLPCFSVCSWVCMLDCVYFKLMLCVRVCVCVWIRDGSVAAVRWKYHRGRTTCPEKSHPHLSNTCCVPV